MNTNEYANADDTQQLLLSVPQVAQRLNIGKSSVYRLLGTGALNHVRLGGRRLIVVEDLNDYVAGLREAARP